MSAVLMIRANVASYDPWRIEYDNGATFRREHGVRGDEVYCSPEDMTSVFVLHYFDTLEAAKSFSSNSEFADLMKSSGVIGAPRMVVAETR